MSFGRKTIELSEETIYKLKRHHARYHKDQNTYDDLISKLLEFYEFREPAIRQYMGMDI